MSKNEQRQGFGFYSEQPPPRTVDVASFGRSATNVDGDPVTNSKNICAMLKMKKKWRLFFWSN